MNFVISENWIFIPIGVVAGILALVAVALGVKYFKSSKIKVKAKKDKRKPTPSFNNNIYGFLPQPTQLPIDPRSQPVYVDINRMPLNNALSNPIYNFGGPRSSRGSTIDWQLGMPRSAGHPRRAASVHGQPSRASSVYGQLWRQNSAPARPPTTVGDYATIGSVLGEPTSPRGTP